MAQLARFLVRVLSHSLASIITHPGACRPPVSLRGPSCLAITAHFVPPCLDRPPHHLAPLLWTDIAPARSAQTDRLPLNWIYRHFSAGNVENLESEVEQRFWGQIRLPHDPAQAHRAANTQHAHEFLAQKRIRGRRLWCA